MPTTFIGDATVDTETTTVDTEITTVDTDITTVDTDITTVTTEDTIDIKTTDGSTAKPPCFIEKESKPECYFLEDVSRKMELFKRCLNFRSGKVKKFSKNQKSVFLDTRKCGVVNATDLKSSNLCFSSLDEIDESKFS